MAAIIDRSGESIEERVARMAAEFKAAHLAEKRRSHGVPQTPEPGIKECRSHVPKRRGR